MSQTKPPPKPSGPPKAPANAEHPAFSIDRETTGMSLPSVTQLLNRKSVTEEIQKGKGKAPPPPPGPSAIQPVPPQQTLSVTHPSPAQEGGQLVKVSQHGREKALTSLKEWTDISPEGFPGASALKELLHEGQKINLWSRMLQLQLKPGGDPKQPEYVATAAWGPSDSALLWDGVHLKPSTMPGCWNSLLKNGYIDLPAVSNDTSIENERRILREALGALPSESMIIVRLGQSQQFWALTVWITNEGMGSKIPAKSLGSWAQPHLKEAGNAPAPA